MTTTTLATARVLNKSTSAHIYWLFIYSLKNTTTNPTKMIRLCPWAFYTPYKNKALPTFVSERPLDIDADEDLDRVLQSAALSTHVVSVSELTLSPNTRVWLLEVPMTAQLKPKYHCHSTLCFYTKYEAGPPRALLRPYWFVPPPPPPKEEEDEKDEESQGEENDDGISEDEKKSKKKEREDAKKEQKDKDKKKEPEPEKALFVPANGAILLKKIKVNLGHNVVLKTNVTLKRLFNVIYEQAAF